MRAADVTIALNAPLARAQPEPEVRPAGELAPLAHVAFCYRCALFCVPLGTKERCPECGEVQPRE